MPNQSKTVTQIKRFRKRLKMLELETSEALGTALPSREMLRRIEKQVSPIGSATIAEAFASGLRSLSGKAGETLYDLVAESVKLARQTNNRVGQMTSELQAVKATQSQLAQLEKLMPELQGLTNNSTKDRTTVLELTKRVAELSRLVNSAREDITRYADTAQEGIHDALHAHSRQLNRLSEQMAERLAIPAEETTEITTELDVIEGPDLATAGQVQQVFQLGEMLVNRVAALSQQVGELAQEERQTASALHAEEILGRQQRMNELFAALRANYEGMHKSWQDTQREMQNVKDRLELVELNSAERETAIRQILEAEAQTLGALAASVADIRNQLAEKSPRG